MNRTGATGDALLAFRLAHWLDLLAAKSPAGGAAAQPVAHAREIDNDVRLPSQAALVSPLPRDMRQGVGAPAPPAPSAPAAAELSVAARAINAVLSEALPQPQPQAARLQGSAPVWPAPQAPSVNGLAAALAQTVSESGLFYESHLAEFAAGVRPLAQLAREPQARLVPAAAAVPAASPASADPLEQLAQQALNVAIHPQAAPLVHQQLDLLESGVFRWSGEAWAGVPMDWSIGEEGEEDGDRQHPAREDTSPPPAAGWSTAVSLTLPRMGRLDLRLTLAASSVWAHIAAHDAQALAQLRDGGAELSRRFAQAGLQVQALQFAEPARP